ncbi:hypothetical protein BFS86_19800 [Shewanella algae]|jgi:hypothetical protein|nr:hypothetical protein BFS86_19800 [Shewanella algae]DAQ47166.1 MAG TPA: hypothetical protein [Caudoviricetes sp.]
MPFAVKFRGKEFTLDFNFAAEDIDNLLDGMPDAQELPGTFNIILHEELERIADITFEEAAVPEQLPFTGVHGTHDGDPSFGEVYIFTGVPDEDEGQVIVLHSREFEPPANTVRYPKQEHSHEN